MSALLLAAMVAAFVALVASVVAQRRATEAPAADEHGTGCRHCAALRQPNQLTTRAALPTIPGPRGGE